MTPEHGGATELPERWARRAPDAGVTRRATSNGGRRLTEDCERGSDGGVKGNRVTYRSAIPTTAAIATTPNARTNIASSVWSFRLFKSLIAIFGAVADVLAMCPPVGGGQSKQNSTDATIES